MDDFDLASVSCQVDGPPGTAATRYSFWQKNASSSQQQISPWHDIPLFYTDATKTASTLEYLYINEIPKGSCAKMEIATDERDNPIKQDLVHRGETPHLRDYHFPSIVNYGCLPQTWENPNEIDRFCLPRKYLGDNDPLDVCEVGQSVSAIGDIYPVKILGALAMIDQGEMDWKVIALALDDPLASCIHTISDLRDHSDALTQLDDIRQWFRAYKVPDGKPENLFEFNGEALDAQKTHDIIYSTHQSYKQNLSNLSSSSSLWLPKS